MKNITKAGIATLVTIGLVASGSAAANAGTYNAGEPITTAHGYTAVFPVGSHAPTGMTVDPITGSVSGTPVADGSFYVWSGSTLAASDKVYTPSTSVQVSGSATSKFTGLLPSATTLGATGYDSLYAFVSTPDNLNLGTNGWAAYTTYPASDAPAATNIGMGNLGVNGTNNGGVAGLFTGTGTKTAYVGVSLTSNSGVVPVVTWAREITINADTDTYTFAADQIIVEATYAPDFAAFAATAGAKAEIRNGNLNIDATVANANKTVDVWAEGTGSVLTVTLDANGKATNTVPAGIVKDTRLAIVETEVEVAWITTTVFDWDTLKPTAGAANEVAIANPADGTTTVTIDAGVANANQTFRAIGWSTETDLGNVTTDASGVTFVDAAALGLGAHTVALFDASDSVVAWGTFTIASSTSSETDVSVTALTSNKFALEGVTTAANLGATKRGTTTAPTALGAFTVVDDRDTTLTGWTLSATVNDFLNATAGGHTIDKGALGIAAKTVGARPDGFVEVLGSPVLAGAGNGSALLATGPAGVSTLEAGVQFDADLTFAVPASAKKGDYTSKLTLTLVPAP